MDLLWPELGKTAATNNLRGALHAARRALAPGDPVAASRYLASKEERIALCPEVELWVDVEAFEERVAIARRGREPAAYRAALDLYTGELLPEDRYEEWAEGRREELRNTYLALRIELAEVYEERGEFGSAIEALGKAVVEEPAHEEAHVGLMRLYALSGRKEEAIRQFERLSEALARELGTEPGATARSLKEEIALERFPRASTPLAGPPPEEPADIGMHNLPAPRTSFVGREHEMVEVKRALAMTGLLTLTGAGGSGKTRLALEAARDLIGAYPDGVWLVELAPLSEETLVPQAVAGVLGVRERPGQPLTDTLVETLRPKTMLLVLDNCEHLVEAAARLVALLLESCPRLRIMATGREALRLMGEVVWPVPLLSVPEVGRPPTVGELEGYASVRLFVERARERDPAFALTSENAQAVAEICARLEGLPLAIELAAVRIKLLPPQAMLSRLGNRFKLLTGGPRDFSERQRTLRSTIEWSYELLGEGEKVLFARFAVFSGRRTLEAIEAVCDAQGDLPVDVLDGASSLLDKSLLYQEEGFDGEPSFVMLETIHEFALEKLEESSDAEAIKRAHAEYFLALAEEAEPGLWGAEDAAWLDKLEKEHDNMRAALSWTIEYEEAELALRLGAALRWFWYMEGYYGEGRRWLEAALGKDWGVAAEARARALEGVGWLASNQGDLDRAQAAAEEGLKLSTEAALGDVVATELQNVLGEVAWERGDYERAKELFEESLAFYREARDIRGVAWSLGNLANVSSDRGNYEQAKELYEEGLALSRELGGAELLGAYLISLGYEFLLEGNPERATSLNEEAVALYRKRGRRGGLQYALDNLGWAALRQGKHERAKTLHEESLVLCRELGDKLIATESLEGLACYAEAKGEAERATRLFGAAEALREAVSYHQRPRDHSLREPYLAAARSRVGEVVWEAAFAERQTMTFEEAVEYALSQEETATPPSPAPERGSADEPPALTRREEEVAELVARGLTNRRIAEELFLSERTVHSHVSSVLKKLSVASREQVAAKIAERQPLNTD